MEDSCRNNSSRKFLIPINFLFINFCFQGNLKFTDVDGEHCSITRSNDNHDQLKWISKLLSCEESDISSALTSRVVATRNEVIQARQNMTRAYYGRDALSKVSAWILRR
jgi:myosin heavy subunit